MFFSTTQFHGFLYMRDGGKKTKLFWLVLTLLSAALCANDFAHLVIVYYGEPTNININIKVNDEIPFKTPTLCMEFGQSIDFTRYWLPVQQLTIEIDKLINMTKGYDMSANIQLTVLTYTYMLLGILTRTELYHTDQSNDVVDLYALSWATHNIDKPSTMSWLLQYYRHQRVSFNALKRVIAAAICRQHFGQFLQYRHPGDKHPQILPFCTPPMITFMGNSLICTKMFQSDTVPTNSSTPYKTFALTGTKLFASDTQFARFEQTYTESRPSSRFYFNLIQTKYLWYLDFEGRPSLPADIPTNIFSWNSMTIFKLDVAVNRRVQMYNRNSRKCSVANDHYSCEWQNRAVRMAQSCNCWPSTLIHISKPVGLNKSDCYTTIKPTTILSDDFIYHQCGQNLSYLTGVENLCLPDCTQISYGVTKNSLGTLGEYNNLFDYNMAGYLEIQFQSDVNSLEITETSATSWSSFIWTFGGSMGTWLGGSVLALLYIPFYMVKKLNELWQRRKKLSPSIPGQINIYDSSKRY